MSENALTRRGLLAGAAGVAALAGCAGYAGFQTWQKAYAEPSEDAEVTQVHTVCDGCDNKCGMIAWVKGGQLWRLSGEPGHPNSRGKLCGRGQGFAAIAYSQDRLTTPLKKNSAGEFTEISWDEALSEIGSAIESAGPDKFALIQSRGSDEFYAKRLVSALGSANYYTDEAVHDADLYAAVNHLGGMWPVPDVENAKFILMFDKSTNDGMRPAVAETFGSLKDKDDVEIVLVDSRWCSFSSLMNEWVPIRPGTELALLLGIAGELVRGGRYNKDFVAAYGSGFNDFATAMMSYTLAWASEKTGIADDQIAELAAKLANNAPAAYVDMPWGGSFGSNYKNSADTVRMVYLINALLGNFNQKGGWMCAHLPEVSPEALEAGGIPVVSEVSKQRATYDAAPLVDGDSCIAAVQAMQRGDLTTVILAETNPVREYPAASEVTAALEDLDCLVVCDVFMNETAQLADYVLPLATYIERTDVIRLERAKVSVAELRQAAIARVQGEARSLSEIITGLAPHCGVGDAFDFSLEEFNRAYAAALGVSYDGLVEAGTAAIPSTEVNYGDAPHFTNESGKIEFSCAAYQEAGLTAVPTWVEPGTPESEQRFRLTLGEQILHSQTYTIYSEQLAEVSKMYNVQAAWINQSAAEALGISEGDSIEIATTAQSLQVRAHVTQCIHPSAIWLPVHFGSTAEKITTLKDFGVAPKQLLPLTLEPGTGAAMLQETSVSVKKVGA